ncbi:ribosomal protein S18, partial [Acephala macrosclerotiorum]
PPRFQCLNMARQASRQIPSLRATFSTSPVLKAGAPSPPGLRYPSSSTRFSNPIQQPAAPPIHSRIRALIARSHERNDRMRQQGSGSTVTDFQGHVNASALSKQITRRFKPGDVYAPHDLSEVEMAKWKKRDKPMHDVFDVLDFNPLDHYRNFSIMSEYMTPMGRIRHSKETGLRPANQRKIAKAIRRSIGMGMMPSVHRHPEILY